MDNRMGLGAFIRARREELGLSQAELARAAGTSSVNLSRWERDDKLPQTEARRQLAAALRINHLDLLVAADLLTAEEARAQGGSLSGPGDPHADRVYTEIDQYEWDEDDATRAVAIIRALMAGRERG